jgi:hypothetical protein
MKKLLTILFFVSHNSGSKCLAPFGNFSRFLRIHNVTNGFLFFIINPYRAFGNARKGHQIQIKRIGRIVGNFLPFRLQVLPCFTEKAGSVLRVVFTGFKNYPVIHISKGSDEDNYLYH